MNKNLFEKKKPIAFLLSLILCLSALISFMFLTDIQTAYAYSDENYHNAGINFLEAQYERKELLYENV